MATLRKEFKGNFEETIEVIKDAIYKSNTASTENEIFEEVNGVRIWLGVFERYSLIGGNRLSMSVNIIEIENDIILNVVTSGGSQGAFYKINTWGEESFLGTIIEPLRLYIEGYNDKFGN